MSEATPPNGDRADLATRIRAAEQRVVAADRDWRRHNDALTEAVRDKAGRVAKMGGIGLGVTTIGLLATLGWRLRPGSRRRQDQFFAQTVAKLRQAPEPRRSVSRISSTLARSPRWNAAVALLGTLLGAATTSGLGLKPGAKEGGGIFAALIGIGSSLLKRWLSGRNRPD